MPTPSSLGHRLTSAASDYYRSQSLVPSDFMPDNKQPTSSILGAISNNPDSSIAAQLCGFDPLDLLDTVDFPMTGTRDCCEFPKKLGRRRQITAEAASEALTEAKLKERQVLKEQLSRSAASIVIQSLFRGFLIRQKYIAVKYRRLTI
ncbi:hypothetical protein BJ741DRAFT_672791 [Chytriomyces cf. hyalinus JEL632]|nr:hypothetical protein BJ741DRAFT_672791 [Chytriomyces cf. hyalinus JEL632]